MIGSPPIHPKPPAGAVASHPSRGERSGGSEEFVSSEEVILTLVEEDEEEETCVVFHGSGSMTFCAVLQVPHVMAGIVKGTPMYA